MLTKKWFTAPEVAAMALPDVPTSKDKVLAMAERHGWNDPDQEGTWWRKRQASGGGTEYHWTVLPDRARHQWLLLHNKVDIADERAAALAAKTQHAERWAWFMKRPDGLKEKARLRARALDELHHEVWKLGREKVVTMHLLSAAYKVSVATLYNWERMTHGIERHDWLPFLVPGWVGNSEKAEIDPKAWDWLYAQYMRRERPTAAKCIRKLGEVAAEQGWIIPSRRTLERMLENIPADVKELKRYGREALRQMLPAQERDRGMFHALEAVNADGHKCDWAVQWPDGFVGRPMLVAFQDLFSNIFLSWRIDRTENREVIRLAFGDMVESHGVCSHAYLDNGRGFNSKWLTGQANRRFRFKVKEGDPRGVMVDLGVQVHNTLPYHGQSKPIERAFRDLTESLQADPRLAGAWLGNSPENKPENRGEKPVPLALFVQVLAEVINEYNTRPNRETKVCGGKKSFRQAFDESLAVHPPRVVGPQHRHLWLLAADQVCARGKNGAIHLMGNRYWSPFLMEWAGKRVTVRFDPDALHDGLHVYSQDGRYLGAAECWEAVGFADAAKAKEHARLIATIMRATREKDAAERKLTLSELAALMPAAPEPPPAAEAKVVRLVVGNTALKPAPTPAEQAAETIDFDARHQRAMARLRAAREE